jgi:ATP-dependent DNA helicase RecG
MPRIDLKELATRESEQVEWKENVANIDEIIETAVAFSNDISNLGGGYIVCGAKETKDEHGFAKMERPGLSANRLKEIEGKFMTGCRERVSPPIHASRRRACCVVGR